MNPHVPETMEAIHDVCSRIENAWSRVSNDIHAFPDIAMEYTEGLDLSVFSDAANLHDVLSIPKVGALQAPSSFSDLYYVLFDNKEFYVEVLNWWGSDINIHDHDFSGVQLQVLDSSLNVEYAFDEDECVDGVATGSLRVSKAELWPQGARSRVVPGMPHNVSHLADPTVSILFRTHPNPRHGPQRNYFGPGVAATYAVHDVNWRKKTSMLRLLSTASDKRRFAKAFHEVVEGQTACETLFTLIKMVDIVFDPELVHVVHRFSDRDKLSGKIAEAAAYYRATELLAKRLKYSCCQSIDETICMSALSSAFDFESFNKIHNDLRQAGHPIDLWRTLGEMSTNVEGRDSATLVTLIDLFGLAPDPMPEPMEYSAAMSLH